MSNNRIKFIKFLALGPDNAIMPKYKKVFNLKNLGGKMEKSIVESLSPLERKIIPFLQETIPAIMKKTSLDETSVLRALKFLENKKIVKISTQQERKAELGDNGVIYIKNNLPERKLLNLLAEKHQITLEEAEKQSKLSGNEFKAALGVLKNKAYIELKENRVMLTAKIEEVMEKSLEEQLLESLEKGPMKINEMRPEQIHALILLQNRKGIVTIKEKTMLSFEITPLGESMKNLDLKEEYIEEVTPEIIKTWNPKKKFRKYDIHSQVPRISGGKKHFAHQAISYGKKIWLEMGFKEMTGDMVVTSFWNFDALFSPQDHPARDMQDTFFLPIKGKLPEKKLVEKVKKAHEQGVGKSKGWQYSWDEEKAKQVVLRTHTTCLSSKTLATLKEKELPAKFFAIGKCFRNETVDWKHGFEFNQTDGIVVDPNANFRHLLYYLKEFAKKMGYTKIRIQPTYYPFTEPSVEGAIWNEQRKQWVEVLAAGIFRPEVTIPLLGTDIPVLAWGPGFDRLVMGMYDIKDLRELYQNDLTDLRNKKMLIK